MKAHQNNMKTHRTLALAAITVFLISFLLPAYSGDSGFSCFGDCWNVFWGHDGLGKFHVFSGGWFYYSGFAISNILFIGLVAVLFATKKISRLRSVISVVCSLQVFSWFVLNVSQLATLGIGYYVWLLSYGLLVAVHFSNRMPPNTALEPTPTAP